MAKKKTSSKKNNNLGKIMYFVAAALGVVALVMLFVTNIKVPNTKIGSLEVEGTGYTGLQIAFGKKEDDVAVLAFSFMGLLPYLLVIAGIALVLVKLFAKKGSAILDFVSIVAFVAAGVLFFLMPSFAVFADNIAGAVASKLNYKLFAGAIVGAIASILAGATILVKALTKK